MRKIILIGLMLVLSLGIVGCTKEPASTGAAGVSGSVSGALSGLDVAVDSTQPGALEVKVPAGTIEIDDVDEASVDISQDEKIYAVKYVFDDARFSKLDDIYGVPTYGITVDEFLELKGEPDTYYELLHTHNYRYNDTVFSFVKYGDDSRLEIISCYDANDDIGIRGIKVGDSAAVVIDAFYSWELYDFYQPFLQPGAFEQTYIYGDFVSEEIIDLGAVITAEDHNTIYYQYAEVAEDGRTESWAVTFSIENELVTGITWTFNIHESLREWREAGAAN